MLKFPSFPNKTEHLTKAEDADFLSDLLRKPKLSWRDLLKLLEVSVENWAYRGWGGVGETLGLPV